MSSNASQVCQETPASDFGRSRGLSQDTHRCLWTHRSSVLRHRRVSSDASKVCPEALSDAFAPVAGASGETRRLFGHTASASLVSVVRSLRDESARECVPVRLACSIGFRTITLG